MPMVLRQNADGSLAVVDVLTGREAQRWNQITDEAVYGGASGPRIFDDFVNPTLLTSLWAKPTKGSDGGTVDFAYNAGVNGRLQGTTGAGAGANMAANGIQIYSGLVWKANMGGLFMEARVQLSAITTISAFVGFTDQVSALEAPIYSAASGNTITTDATDGCGFMFDTSMTNATWWAQGVANDVDATGVNSGVAPVAATYDTLRVELDTAGNGTFFINGAQVGSRPIAGCVTETVALTPTITVFRRAASSATMLIDYIAVGANRV